MSASASVPIEVLEFSDRSRLSRFSKDDLQTMVDKYDAITTGRKNRRVAPQVEPCWCCEEDGEFQCQRYYAAHGKCVGVVVGFCGIIFAIMGVIFLVLPHDDDDDDDNSGASFMIAFGIICIVLGCISLIASALICLYQDTCQKYVIDHTKTTSNGGQWLGPEDILILLTNEVINVRVMMARNDSAAGEKQPLLQGGGSSQRNDPGYYLLLERPEHKALIAPTAFLTAEYKNDFPEELTRNKFAGLIKQVVSQLRSQGVTIHSRYYLTRVGISFAQVKSLDVMPEADMQ